MIKFPGYLTKRQARQSNQITLVVLLFVILIPLYFNQSLSAENDNLFISNTGGRTTATIIIRESPIKVWEVLTNYEEIGIKMPDIKKVKLIKNSNKDKIIEHTYKAPYTFGQKVKALIEVQEIPKIIISYKLIKSNRIKKLEGSWIINPIKDGTLLTHNINLEPDLPSFLKPYFRNLFEDNLEKSMKILKHTILENE